MVSTTVQCQKPTFTGFPQTAAAPSSAKKSSRRQLGNGSLLPQKWNYCHCTDE
jgi:hypothetical protein